MTKETYVLKNVLNDRHVKFNLFKINMLDSIYGAPTQNQNIDEPPPLNWSSAMFRKRRTENGEQASEAGRDYHEVTAS